MRRDEFLHFVFIPVVLGIIGGFSAILFRKLIAFFKFLFVNINFLHNDVFYLFTMPFIFLFSYFLINKLLINTSNITLDHIAKKISLMAGNFSIIKGLLVLFLTSLNIGFGLPVGREAPIAKLGGLLGEIFIKIIKVAKVNIPIYLAAAVSSAIAATFNAPLAGVILAIEIIVGRINTYIIIPLIVSTATATLIAREFLGDYTAFFVPHLEFSNIYFYIVPIVGVVFALLSVVVFYFFEFFRKLRVTLKDYWYKIVVFNGFLVGLLIWAVPEIRGVGYEYITALFKNGFDFYQVFIITFTKLIAIIITFGSGLFGGLMSPSIFIGAFGGYMIGDFFIHLGADPRVLALVGSVAMLAGISKAPLRSTIIIIELTHSYQLLIPSLIASSITAFIVSKYEPGGYFKRSLIQKGIDIENPNVLRFLDKMKVYSYLVYIEPLRADLSVKEAFLHFRKNNFKSMPVVDENNKLIGVLSFKDIRLKLKNKNEKIKNVLNTHPIVWRENYKSDEIVKVLGLISSEYVPYVNVSGEYEGMVNLKKLLKDLSMIDRYKII
ncbi:chloride channel protein [Caminibacter pacificus]|uniref:Chloride channel protein n=1 Tax=Caminibacter pacificus TaxID=1424653 RepID=A0AAJ4RCZ2_9BACT|nr:chloride channel protein [Caminibacter pacificus]NPA87923.1 chloride channel protein [Campylobacterota bacterium]QCI27717.1 chloride channel protein [Caminibacter pacificus]ROR40107.1 CIC family chloride channel protein [Caminibacter pacificus]